jgi:hypothetical protein
MELLLIKKPLNKVEVITSKLLWSPWICPVCHNQDPVILSSYMTSWKITCHWFIIKKNVDIKTCVAWLVPLVDLELLTLQEHLHPSTVFSWNHVTQSVISCLLFSGPVCILSSFYVCKLSVLLPLCIVKHFSRQPVSCTVCLIYEMGPSLSWSYGSWIYNFMWNQC